MNFYVVNYSDIPGWKWISGTAFLEAANIAEARKKFWKKFDKNTTRIFEFRRERKTSILYDWYKEGRNTI
jgi:hypothetical protein